MKIVVGKHTERISFRFEPDELDAVVPLEEVWLRGVSRIPDGNLALMAYLMVRSVTANIMTFVDVDVPAHLAARMIEDFPAHELFVSPVTNSPEKIAPPYRHQILCLDRDRQNELSLHRTPLGYQIRHGDEVMKEVTSNVDLYATLLPSQPLLSELVIYLAVHHELGIRVADFIAANGRNNPCSISRLAPLFREVASDLHPNG